MKYTYYVVKLTKIYENGALNRNNWNEILYSNFLDFYLFNPFATILDPLCII